MPNRFDLIFAFQDTLRRVQTEEPLREAVLPMQAGTQLYLGGYSALMPRQKSEAPVVEVVEDTSFHCAQGCCCGRRVAVLSFANAYTPGGGVTRGAMAQEECLCRSSTLYAALTLPYLVKNYYEWNQKHTGWLGSDAVIYTPGVTVFKDDAACPQPLEEWFTVDVLTCAAPCCRTDKPVDRSQLAQVLEDRVRNILEVAAAQDVDVLVLGAFGCGAFANPPDLVAQAFRYWLVDRGYGRLFERVVFAIKANDAQNSNLLAFRAAFAAE